MPDINYQKCPKETRQFEYEERKEKNDCQILRQIRGLFVAQKKEEKDRQNDS